jgi:hypothetical protein
VLSEKGISTHDFLWVSNSASRLYRGDVYLPLRGTLVSHGLYLARGEGLAPYIYDFSIQ